jgi:hypothetical protein
MRIVRCSHILQKIVKRIVYTEQVYKKDLRFGDLVLITSENSEYYIYVLECGSYLVMGGWFDRKRLSPAVTRITGCTWGGSIIKTDVIASCGLYVEFSNGLRTSGIQKVVVCRRNAQN